MVLGGAEDFASKGVEQGVVFASAGVLRYGYASGSSNDSECAGAAAESVRPDQFLAKVPERN